MSLDRESFGRSLLVRNADLAVRCHSCYVVFSDHFPTEPVYQAADPLLQLPYETILAIFAMPQADGGLDALTDEGIKQLAEACKVLNDKGLRVMVVFGHEVSVNRCGAL